MVWRKQPVPQCGEDKGGWWWTSGETLLTTPHWPSTPRLWRESAALNSWGCTSQRTSPGLPTPSLSPRRHNSAYTFSAGWKEQVSLHHPHHLLQGYHWERASLSGTETAVQQTARPSSGQWTPLQKSLVPLSPPSWIFSLHDAPAKHKVSWRDPTHPSHSLFQLLPSGRRYRRSEPAPPDLLNSFFPQAVRSPELTSHRPPPPPPPYHISGKNCFKLLFLCNQVSGPAQATVATHSPLHALDNFTHHCVSIIPQRLIVIYDCNVVCLLAHAPQITLHCSPAAAWMSLFLHLYSIEVICHSCTVVLYFIYYF